MPTYRTQELGTTVLCTTVKEKDLGVTISADSFRTVWYCSFKR